MFKLFNINFEDFLILLIIFKFFYLNQLRLRLPTPMIDRSQISIWSILKQNIGKVNNSLTIKNFL